MIAFMIVAAVMAAIAAAAVAVPLLRDRRNRPIAALAAVLLVVGAGGLYALWSTWDWGAAPQPGAAAVSPQVAAMVANLERHMRADPQDLAGWLMLGRSYVAVNRLDDAIAAFNRALTLSKGTSLEATIGYGEALSIRAGGVITPHAAQLFEDAMMMAPTNPKALLYGGFAAAVRGDRALARSRWQALIAMHPPQPVVQMLDARIAELGPPAAGAAAPDAGSASAASPTTASPTTASPTNAAPAATVTVRVMISPALEGRVRAGVPLFVFAQRPGGSGPPLAAKRLTTAAIGTVIRLSRADSMIPGRVLSAGEQVVITARISPSGEPLPAAGDMYGELTYDVGHDGTANLLIDHVTP
ncbi:MAG TPA: hypothetical protein VMV25_01615 [Steroidobacteraceae bacterium]|nr:hypothetical protein [Steroidobacteraceae bacterium]